VFKSVVVTFIILLGVVVVVAIIPIRRQDKTLYEELMKSSNPDSKEEGLSPLSYSQHRREGVSKQIWYQDDAPLYFRIDSAESELFFFRQEGQIEVIEQLGSVACIMQEELFYEGEVPMQKIRYLEAEHACYNYNTHLFVARDVKLWKYQLEGHTPPAKIEHINPLMRATANSVEFTLQGKKLDFIAHQMKASVNSKERSL
jgi:hypothetical protein